MYKKLYVCMLAAVLTASYAQSQITFGARAGFALTNQSIKYDGKKPDKEDRSKMKPGIQIGIIGEYTLDDAISFQSGLVFATQGFRYKFSDEWEDFGTVETKTTLNINYLQIPVNALYQMDMGGGKLVFQAGPYLGLALGGKSKSKEKSNGRTETDKVDVKFGSEVGEMKRIDLGLGLGAGVQFNNIRAGLEYKFGVTNLSNFDKSTQRNNGLTLSMTYLFGI